MVDMCKFLDDHLLADCAEAVSLIFAHEATLLALGREHWRISIPTWLATTLYVFDETWEVLGTECLHPSPRTAA